MHCDICEKPHVPGEGLYGGRGDGGRSGAMLGAPFAITNAISPNMASRAHGALERNCHQPNQSKRRSSPRAKRIIATTPLERSRCWISIAKWADHAFISNARFVSPVFGRIFGASAVAASVVRIARRCMPALATLIHCAEMRIYEQTTTPKIHRYSGVRIGRDRQAAP